LVGEVGAMAAVGSWFSEVVNAGGVVQWLSLVTDVAGRSFVERSSLSKDAVVVVLSTGSGIVLPDKRADGPAKDILPHNKPSGSTLVTGDGTVGSLLDLTDTGHGFIKFLCNTISLPSPFSGFTTSTVM